MGGMHLGGNWFSRTTSYATSRASSKGFWPFPEPFRWCASLAEFLLFFGEPALVSKFSDHMKILAQLMTFSNPNMLYVEVFPAQVQG